MSKHDECKWEVATYIAREIRERKRTIAGDFLWIAENARQLKADGQWQAVAEKWDDFVADTEVGFGMAPSSIRNLISLFEVFIASKLLTHDEATQTGWHRLQASKASINKIAISDQPKAKEILTGVGKMADIKRDLRELVPEDQRKPLDVEEKCIRTVSKLWSQLNEVEMETVSEDFVGRMQEYFTKCNGYMLR